MRFPQMVRVRQQLVAPTLPDIRTAVRAELHRLNLAGRVQAGQRIAIPAGSRGMANIVTILDTVVQEMQALGLMPFVFPAMGSHGAVTAEGQREVLATYGVTEERLGVPIRATMELVELGRTPRGILIVDEMGKDISGSGMDTNVIGRVMVIGEPEPATPKILRIYVVRDLSEKTSGNAIGVGLADFCSQRLAAKIDPLPTQINCVTAMTPENARLPLALTTDQEAIATALTTVGPIEPWEARVMRIKNTLEMEEFQVSEALLDELKGRSDITPIGGLEELRFDADGNLPPIFHHQRQFDRG